MMGIVRGKRSFLVLLGLSVALGASAVVRFETPKVLRAQDVLPQKLLKSPVHQVKANVESDGFLNYFQVETRFSPFEAHGTHRLTALVHEIEALEELDRVSKTSVFIDSAKQAGVNTIKSVGTFVRNPIATIKGIPAGIGRLFGRAKSTASSATSKETSADGDKESETQKAKRLSERWLGVTDAERRWAERLGTDPYTPNELLLDVIKEYAWAERLGSLGVNILVPSIPGVGIAAKVSNLVWSKSPLELRKYNLERLVEMGISQELADEFIEYPFYSPSQQTTIVSALETLEGVSGKHFIINQALTKQSSDTARFLTSTCLFIGWYQATAIAPIDRILEGGPLPLVANTDNRALALFPVDYLFWTERAAAATDEYVDIAESANLPLEFWFTGDASPQSKRELESRNVKLWTGYGERVFAPAAEQAGT